MAWWKSAAVSSSHFTERPCGYAEAAVHRSAIGNGFIWFPAGDYIAFDARRCKVARLCYYISIIMPERTTVVLPPPLKQRAVARAREQGISFGEFVRRSV